MVKPLLKVPREVTAGEAFEVRILIQHPMETGYRPGADGKVLARDLIRRFSCRYDDGSGSQVVFAAELYAAVAANPLISFHTVATASGTLTFTWEGDNGFMQSESVAIKVT